MAHEVLIDFVPDFSKLDTAMAELEKSGAVDKKLADSFKSTTAEINKQATAIKNTAGAFKAPIQSIDQLDKRTKSFIKNFVGGFEEGVNEALQEAGVSMNEFIAALEQGGIKGNKATVSLKQELRALTEQIALAKANGTDLGAEYDALVQKAGKLKDAVKDAGAEIANAGSDTRNIDNVVGSISALAGGFSALQGAQALFGNESEDLQRTLLKVNAAMAISQGLQQVLNALQKEGSLIKLADVAATKSQVFVQQVYTAVTGKATQATVAFKVALAATGIGAAVLLILTLVDALKSHNNVLEETNKLLEKQKQELDDFNDALDINTRNRIANAEAAGKSEAEVARISESALIRQKARLQEQNAELEKRKQIIKDGISQVEQFGGSTNKLTESLSLLNGQLKENNKSLADLDTQQNELNSREIVRQREEEKKSLEEQKRLREKAAQDAKAAREKALQEAREARLREFEDFKAGKELELLRTKEGSEEQLAARKELLRAQLTLDLENEKLTDNQKRLLIQKFFRDRLDLEKTFFNDREEVILSAIASDLNTELQQLNLSNERKLELTESAIRIQSELEILAAQGNAAKIEEINAKTDKAIRDARLASLNQITEYEIQLASASDGSRKRALDRIVNDERKSVDVRIGAINSLLEAELDTIQKRIDANQEAFDKGLISQQDYNLQSAILNDQYNAAWEAAAQKRTEITQQENEKQKESDRERIELVLETLSQVVGVLDQLYAGQTQAENNRIEAQKKQLDELLEAGAITEKEAITRQKRIEAEERKARQRQAQREKQIAVFNALLAIPQAILQGLKEGGPILAAIYGGLATIQAGIVIARPIPKFASGKKGSYSGFCLLWAASFLFQMR